MLEHHDVAVTLEGSAFVAVIAGAVPPTFRGAFTRAGGRVLALVVA